MKECKRTAGRNQLKCSIAAVHEEILSCDVRGSIRSKKHRRAFDIIRAGHPSERRAITIFLDKLLGHRWRIKPARTQTIDSYPQRPEINGQITRQLNHSGLRESVARWIRHFIVTCVESEVGAHDSINRPHIDYAGATLPGHYVAKYPARSVQHGGIAIHRLCPIADRMPGQWLRPYRHGIVDQHIQLSPSRFDLRRKAFDRLLLRQVQRQTLGVKAVASQTRSKLLAF